MTVTLSSIDFCRAVDLAVSALGAPNGSDVSYTAHVRTSGEFEIVAAGDDIEISITAPCVADAPATFMMTGLESIGNAVSTACGITPAPGNEVSIVPGKTLKITAGAMTLAIENTPDVADWPERPEMVEAFAVELSADCLDLLSRLQSAMSRDETRYYLNGIHLHHVEEAKYRAVATDGHRLLMTDMLFPDATGKFAGIIIPATVIAAMLRLMPNGCRMATDAALRMTVTGSNGPHKVTIQAKLIDGKYPDYTRVIPKTALYSAVFKATELRGAVVALKPVWRERKVIKLTFSAGRATLVADDRDALTGSFEVACENDLPPDFSIAFNAQYIIDTIDATGGDEIVFGFDDAPGALESVPVLARSPDRPVSGVLSPMRI